VRVCDCVYVIYKQKSGAVWALLGQLRHKKSPFEEPIIYFSYSSNTSLILETVWSSPHSQK